jgi:hypothetical protein
MCYIRTLRIFHVITLALWQHSSKCATQELLTLLVPGTTFSLAKGSQISSSRVGLLSPLLSKLWADAELSHYHVLYESRRQHVPLRMQPPTTVLLFWPADDRPAGT